jgi:hypothetical protein
MGYRLKMDLLPCLELALGVYALFALSRAITTPAILISPFLFMYTCGFFYIAFKGIGESLDWTIGKFRPPPSTASTTLEKIDGI